MNTLIPLSKLWIVDLLRYCSKSSAKNVGLWKGKDIKLVDIFGVITHKKKSGPYLIYSVDDGTGVMPCYINSENEHNMQKYEYSSNTLCDLLHGHLEYSPQEVEALRWLMDPILKYHEDLKKQFSIGDTVNVRGMLANYNGGIEVQISAMWQMEDEIEECLRIFEVLLLYQNLEKKQKEEDMQLLQVGDGNQNV